MKFYLLYGWKLFQSKCVQLLLKRVVAEKLLTLYFDPHEVLLNIEIQFDRDSSAEDITQAIDHLESKIQSHYPDIRNIFVEAKLLTGHKDNR